MRKNNLASFESPLRERKSCVFLFVKSSFVPEIFKFLHYATLITDEVIGRSGMKSKHKINTISANNRAM